MRFFYYYPTWNKPSGGNKQLRLMAKLLGHLGVESFLLRDQQFFGPSGSIDDNQFYGVDVALAPFSFEEAGAHLSGDDVLLLPEVLLESSLATCQGWKCRVALNNQNGFYALRYAPRGAAVGRRLEFALANAPYVASICREFLGVPSQRIFHIPHWVVRPPFELGQGESFRQLAVCYMPRKLPDEVRKVRALVESTHPEVPWVEIDGLPEPEVARRYRENSIFFAAQDLEGCPLTALEAMACGCLVAGYGGTGQFAHPYATADNGLWVPDRDVQGAACAIRSAIDLVRGGGDRWRRYLEMGRRTAARFGEDQVCEALAGMVSVVGKRAYDARRHEIPKFNWRSGLYAYRLLYDYDRLGWPGGLVSRLSRATKPLRQKIELTRN